MKYKQLYEDVSKKHNELIESVKEVRFIEREYVNKVQQLELEIKRLNKIIDKIIN